MAGVVLHSPLMSGLRVMRHFDKTYWFDIYPVVEQIQHVFAPVFVIHGNEDQEIDVLHGKILSRIAPNAFTPWFVPYAGHNDIEVMFPEALFEKLNQFQRYLRTLERKYRSGAGKHCQQSSLDDDEEDIDDEEDELEEERNDDDGLRQIKSVTEKNEEDSLSPPPPQSIMTKSTHDGLRQIAIPSLVLILYLGSNCENVPVSEQVSCFK